MNERRNAAYVLEIPRESNTTPPSINDLPIRARIGNVVEFPDKQVITGHEADHDSKTHTVGATVVFPGEVNGDNNAHHEKRFKKTLRENGITLVRAKIKTMPDGSVEFARLKQGENYGNNRHTKKVKTFNPRYRV